MASTNVLLLLLGALLLGAALLLGLIYHRVRELLYATQRAGRRVKVADANAATRWLEDEARAYLAHLLETEPAALPPSGPYVARADFLTLIAQHIRTAKPFTVVEFGAGASTLAILRCLRLNGRGKLITYDHDPLYAEITRQRAELAGFEPDIRVVPLVEVEGYAGRWYEIGDLPAEIDCIVVDGPPSTVHPETREGAASLFSSLSAGGAVFLDDTSRRGEIQVVGRWSQDHPELEFRMLGTTNGTAIGRKKQAADKAAPAG